MYTLDQQLRIYHTPGSILRGHARSTGGVPDRHDHLAGGGDNLVVAARLSEGPEGAVDEALPRLRRDERPRCFHSGEHGELVEGGVEVVRVDKGGCEGVGRR